MTTFGLAPSESFDPNSFGSQSDASIPLPDIEVLPPPDNSHYGASSSNEMSGGHEPEPVSPLEEDDMAEEDYPFIATQPQTQSQHCSWMPDRELELIGCLIPVTAHGQQLDLLKSKPTRVWKIGRHPGNDLVLPGMRLSNSHCRLIWNGQTGRHCEVTLEDTSTNGTWVNNAYVRKGQRSILRSGAAISLGGAPDTANNDYRFVFRDIEGQSTRNAEQIWQKYDLGYELGAGAFARVYKCMERATGTEYAVKIINKGKMRTSAAGEKSVIREIEILKQLADFRHKNIVTLHEHYEEKDAIYLVMEFVRGGDLLAYMGIHGRLSEDQVRRIAAQMCHAIAYVHSQGIAHRDLKPENVLLTASSPPDCKIADFGLAKLVDDQTFLKTMCGTPAYLAPEVILRTDERRPYDDRVDSWSFGVIIYCLLTNASPFRDQVPEDRGELPAYMRDRKVDWKPLKCVHLSDAGMDFLQNILTVDPRGRKHVSYMLDHQWISSLIPSDSQFQLTGTERSATPTATDSALVCSQSLQNLKLSDMEIPGLSTINQQAAMDSNPTIMPKEVQSFTSEVSVTSKIPGAYPKSKTDKTRQLLAAVGEAGETDPWTYEMVTAVPDSPSSSRRTVSPTTASEKKRKNDLIGGSSPLSSLSSDEDEGAKVPLTRRSAPPRSSGKAADTAVSKRKRKRKLHALPSAAKTRRSVPPKEEDESSGTRKSTRRPPTKVPRYS